MADRLKDDMDRKLEALFASAQVEDDGFSARVVSRVRRQIWVQRLSLPVAILVGAVLAAKPFWHLATLLPQVFQKVLQGVSVPVDLPVEGMPQLSTIVMAVLVLVVTMMVGRALED